MDGDNTIAPKKEWIVVNENGVRQHNDLLTEEQASKLERQLLTESEGKSVHRFTKKRQLHG